MGKESILTNHFAALAALAAMVFSVPAVAETPVADVAPVDWGLALAGGVLPEGKLHKLRYPICLLVAADDRAFARQIAARVIDNAEEAGIAVRRGRCQYNTLIAFTDDAVGQLREMRRYYLSFYGAHYLEQLDHMFATETAAFAFHEPMQLWMGPEVFQGTREVIGQPDVMGAAVVIDKAAAEGLDPVQLADYATLRLLAPTADTGMVPQAAPEGAATILTLFRDRAGAPGSMTDFDRAYLRTLYGAPRGSSARNVMARASKIALADDGS